MRGVLLSVVFVLGVPVLTHAEVTALKILKREPFGGGKEFGRVGAYEKITAIAHFAIDPANRHNKGIVDLTLAPRNAQGKVEFEADVVLLVPCNLKRGNSTLFYEVNNRGNKLALRMFNNAPGGNDLDKPGSAGDGFLLEHGFTVVWSGWIGELLPGDGRLLLKAPVATDKGKPIRGVVRFEMSSDRRVSSVPLSRREAHGSYSPTAEGERRGVLTKRLRETDERQEIPRSQWKLERDPVPTVKEGVKGTLAPIRLKLRDGFEPGVLYELICECEGPIVQGVGLASVRDLVSFLRYEKTNRNPLCIEGKPAIHTALAFGVSQSGRFLRHFLWQGFNEDVGGQIVFDGLMPHVAGGGLGFFNHRFAQPTRHNGQHEDHQYPADLFPFTYGTMTDPLSRRTDGILRAYEKTRCMPRVMHTQSAAEYWHRSGSLVHTDPLGKEDAKIPANVRIYAFGGTQHGPAAWPPTRGNAQNLANPGDYRLFLRELILQLRAWCKDERSRVAPSVYPRLATRTLVDWHQRSTGFPRIPGVAYPTVIQQPFHGDWGAHFFTEGRIETEPPRIVGRYTVLVPRCDPDGNELGMLQPPEVKVPVATFTGWNLRREEVGAGGMLANLTGSYLPFAKTRAERLQTGDPRLSLEERYGTFETYEKRFVAGTNELKSWARQPDLDRAIEESKKRRTHFPR